jgi:hypothetical protein
MKYKYGLRQNDNQFYLKCLKNKILLIIVILNLRYKKSNWITNYFWHKTDNAMQNPRKHLINKFSKVVYLAIEI